MTIGDRIKNLREEIDLKQKDLAKILNISVSNISKYENNETQPSIDIIKKISQHFNVSTDYLIGLTPAKNIEEFKEIRFLISSLPEEDLDSVKLFIRYLWFKNLQKWENELNEMENRK